MPGVQEPQERRWRPAWPIDLRTTLGPLHRGGGDPTMALGPGGAWRATHTPQGPVTVHCARVGDEVVVRAWGPGAERELALVPSVLGAGDDPTGFAADAHPVMAQAYRRFGSGWRVPRTGRVLEALVPAILEQRVTGLEARRSWRALVLAAGEPAPGAGRPGVPALHLPPTAQAWLAVPSWTWHRAGVDPGRAATVVRAAARAQALERLSDRAPAEAARALCAIPGIGAWTAAEVAVRAWGDPDAVSFGDFHLARNVVHALTGRRDGTDAELAELLEPWAGQRARAVRMLELHCGAMPRRGPRAAITDHRAW
jgi:3-methyladenine DNA glycosylase/8-oxoguanine DNA glycosylase